MKKAPIYTTPTRKYLVDSCRPQRRAIEEGVIEWHALSHGHYPGDLIPQGALPKLSNIGFFDAVGPQAWGTEPHRNEGIEITFLETGSMAFVVDDEGHQLNAGALTVTRPWQSHCLGDPHIGPGRLYWFIIDVGVRRPNQQWRWPRWVVLAPDDIDELTTCLRQNAQPVWHGTAEIASAFTKIGRALEDCSMVGRISRIVVHLNQLLLAILDMLRQHDVEVDPHLISAGHTVSLFLQDLQQNPDMLARPWTIAEMAQHCGMGVTALTRYCRQLVNTSPMRHLTRCRIERGAVLLRQHPPRPITEIALDCGFSSSQYFAVQFRNVFGSSPRDYRQRNTQHRT